MVGSAFIFIAFIAPGVSVGVAADVEFAGEAPGVLKGVDGGGQVEVGFFRDFPGLVFYEGFEGLVDEGVAEGLWVWIQIRSRSFNLLIKFHNFQNSRIN